jgi:hypothetical protein
MTPHELETLSLLFEQTYALKLTDVESYCLAR